MGRLILSAQMTMDSAMDQLENWFEPEGESEVDGLEELRAASVVILGRETSEVLSTPWSSSESMYAGLINRSRKYVASRTLEGLLAWNAQLFGRDTAQAKAALKDQQMGSSSFTAGTSWRTSSREGLVDEVRFWLHAVVWGGVRPFPAGELPVQMRLIGATTFISGAVRLAYEPLAQHRGG